jgi:hypothetical protein
VINQKPLARCLVQDLKSWLASHCPLSMPGSALPQTGIKKDLMARVQRHFHTATSISSHEPAAALVVDKAMPALDGLAWRTGASEVLKEVPKITINALSNHLKKGHDEALFNEEGNRAMMDGFNMLRSGRLYEVQVCCLVKYIISHHTQKTSHSNDSNAGCES